MLTSRMHMFQQLVHGTHKWTGLAAEVRGRIPKQQQAGQDFPSDSLKVCLIREIAGQRGVHTGQFEPVQHALCKLSEHT